jgi:hypothetical protein
MTRLCPICAKNQIEDAPGIPYCSECKAEIEAVKKYVCHICGKKNKSTAHLGTCVVCGKYSCSKHTKFDSCWNSPCGFDDVSFMFCQKCWDIGKNKYVKIIESLKDKLENDVDKIKTEWQQEAEGNKNDQH